MSERSSSRTSDMGLRREPHPPMPMVMPLRSSDTTSASVVRLSGIATWPSGVGNLMGRQILPTL